jgi:ParB family chromosome partitioning protein
VLARRLGKNRSTIANALRLLRLDPAHQAMVVEGRISAGHARCLLAVEEDGPRQALANKILADDLSVREAEEWVRKEREAPKPEPGAEPPAPRVTPLQPYYESVAADLGRALEAEVHIQSRGRKGRICINFKSLDDLRRLKALLDPSGDLARTA